MRIRKLWRTQFTFMSLTFLGLTCQLLSLPRSARISEGPAASFAVQSALPIPVGYILPVQLDDTLSVKDARAGDALQARIMQDVPLPDRGRIHFRSLVKGSVVAVAKDEDGTGSRITMRFNQVIERGQDFSVATGLRALASYQTVRLAQTPRTEASEGSAGWATTIQIGGDVRYGDGGIVRSRKKETVGKGVLGGVLVHVKANPQMGCEGPVNGDDHPQALWVFSADACGVYGLTGVEMIHNGQSGQSGEFTLHFEKLGMKLESGTGMLLRVVSRP